MHRRRTCIETLENPRLLAAVPIRMIDGEPIATIEWQGEQREMFAGRWMVQLDGYQGNLLEQQARAQQTINAVNRGLGVLRHMGADGLFLVQAPEQMQAPDVIDALDDVPGFRAIGPDFRYELLATPNDPMFGQMWGLHQASDTDIDAPEAWDLGTGTTQTVVGMVDSGIDWSHPDLNDNIWINTLETPGNLIDDDLNGYIDDVRGWDWWTAAPGDNNPADENNHGTHTAGTVGAEGNNGMGVVGVNWNVKLMALKIGGAGSSVSGAAAVSAMNYVLAMKNRLNSPVNVRVTNHSWGGGGFDSFMSNAIAAHATAGILTVCAAGNNGQNIESTGVQFYPAEYNFPNVFSVGNHTSANARNSGSNYGATAVDLFAPGTSVMSTIRVAAGSYNGTFTGTSMASPHVAGVAALMFSLMPSASATAVKNAIMSSVDVFPSYTGFCLSNGRLNARAALNALANVPVAPAQPDLDASSDRGRFDNDNFTSDNTPTFTGTGATAGNTILIFSNGAQVGSGVVAAGGTWSVTTSALADGVRTITARQQNAGGTSGDSPLLNVTFDTVAPTFSTLFAHAQSPNFLNLSFGEEVGWSLAANDFTVDNLTLPGALPLTATYDNALHTARLTFTGLPVLPDANFRMTLLDGAGPGGGVQDIAGNAIPTTAFDFFFLMGDANRDKSVNLVDFNAMAANFGQNFRGWDQGDFNYDNVVNLVDFNLLASRFGQALAAPASAASPFGQSSLGDADEETDELLA